MISLAGLAVFSGLSLNLLLQCALGTAAAVHSGVHKNNGKNEIPLAQIVILFVSVISLWFFLANILPAGWRGFAEYFLFFPLSALACMGLELLSEKILRRIVPVLFPPDKYPPFAGIKRVFSAVAAYDGLVPAALFITAFAAGNFQEAVVISLFFTLGNFSAMCILNEIKRRAALERVPRHLRGTPLILISMGLLSLISASAAGICFKILELF